jgi:hypothetical protein
MRSATQLRPRIRNLVAVASIATAAVLVLAAPASAASPSVPVEAVGIHYVLDGSFTLDHFDVKTPLSYPVFVNPPTPHLVAVGTLSGVITADFPPTVQRFSDIPFVWVNVSVVSSCGGEVRLSLDRIGGSDYVGFGPIYGQPLWDDSVPIPFWDRDVHWFVPVAPAPIELAANRGLACAAAELVAHGNLNALAATLNSAVRRYAQ